MFTNSPFTLLLGSGQCLYDEDGTEYLDGVNNVRTRKWKRRKEKKRTSEEKKEVIERRKIDNRWIRWTRWEPKSKRREEIKKEGYKTRKNHDRTIWREKKGREEKEKKKRKKHQ